MQVTGYCEHCGKLFIPKRVNQVYCTPECRIKNKTLRGSGKRTVKRDEQWNNENRTGTCLVCGKSFTLRRAFKFQKYCSKVCSKRAERIYGNKRETDLEYHNQERFGGNKYKVLERDNYACQQCGNISQLVVHHID